MNKIDRREFIIAAVCTAAGCADIGAGEKQIAHFGMATDMHYADLPNAVDDPGEAWVFWVLVSISLGIAGILGVVLYYLYKKRVF